MRKVLIKLSLKIARIAKSRFTK